MYLRTGEYVAANAQHGMCALVRWLHNIQNVKWAKNRPTTSYLCTKPLSQRLLVHKVG